MSATMTGGDKPANGADAEVEVEAGGDCSRPARHRARDPSDSWPAKPIKMFRPGRQ
jgi:hypothetical protein